MDRKKPYIYKRVLAYIIDLLVITLIAGMLTKIFTNNEEYDKDLEKQINVIEKYTNKEITLEEYNSIVNVLNYRMISNSTNVTFITICTTVVYYTIMCYFCKGITIGKYIFKLRIVSANGDEVSILNYFIRCLLVNNVLANAVTIVMVKYLTKEAFINSYDKVSNVFTVFILISFLFMMFRNDGRGLHDLASNTMIINSKDKDIKKEEIQEAKIEEKTNKKESE